MTAEWAQLESKRFGHRIARAGGLDAESARAALEWAREAGADMLIARCPTADVVAANVLEQGGGRLLETAVTYRRSLRALPGDGESGALEVASGDSADAVAELARSAFRGYPSHFHLDPRLDDDACEATYEDWARRCATDPAMSDLLLVARDHAGVHAFGAFQLGSDPARVVLAAVAPSGLGRGLYRSLLDHGLALAAADGRSRGMEVRTTIVNTAVQADLAAAGFRLAGSEYTFHCWLRD
jgi:hypothetical protein